MHASKAAVKELGRLQKRADFLRVQRQGRKWTARGLMLQVAENGTDKSRFGLTVTKRLSKSAVVRNRIRRRLRAAACDVLPVHGKKGFDYILCGRAESPSRLYTELCRDLKWCLGKLDCLREDTK